MIFELDILDDNARNEQENPDLSVQLEPKKLWRSVEDLERSPEYQSFIQNEFINETTTDELPSGQSRRRFMQIMGASAAMLGLAACRRPVEKILPYVKQPEEIIPGKPLYYATAMPLGGIVRPILIESHEGRPTKAEGNPEHPMNKGVGATGLFEQASLLTMFDPDRTKSPLKEGKEVAWDEFQMICRDLVSVASIAKVAVLAPSSSSPTLNAIKNRFLAQYPNGRWVTYDSTGDENEVLGSQLAFGQSLRPLNNFSTAKVIVSFDADFLSHTNNNSVWNNREYAASRRVMSVEDQPSRMYVVESGYSITGGMADNRLKLRSSEIPAFVAAVASKLGVSEASSLAGEFADHEWVSELVKDLEANSGAGIVLAGSHQAPVVHALCLAINQALGNIGSSVELLNIGDSVTEQGEALNALVSSMNGGEVDTLIMLGSNPVYDAPADLKFEEALSKVATSVHVGLWNDETAQVSTMHLPLSYFIESWGDGRAFDGTQSIIQPLIAPIYDSRSEIEIANMLVTGIFSNGYDLVKQTWQGSGDWDKVVHDGFLADSSYPKVTGGSVQSLATAIQALPEIPSNELEIVVKPSIQVFDGTFSNNAWMQELPHSITKVVWDNVALMSPKTAKDLGVGYEITGGNYFVDIVTVNANGQEIEIPAWIVHGFPDNSIQLELGYGRNFATARSFRDIPFFDIDTDVYNMNRAPLANGVGSSVEKLRTLAGMSIFSGKVTKSGSGYKLVTTQDHGALDWEDKGAVQTQVRRDVFRSTSLETYKKHNTAIREQREEKLHGADEKWEDYPALWQENHPTNQELTKDSIYFKYQWGMTIDLNSCTGCNACVIACQSENNIQVVGKEVVGQGRETSWIRLDRYFTDNPENPGMVLQPLMCHHCENAPCESVCPVAATSHSPDGINEMTYNRCIGTRYCANNCPYKVRRFNYFNWVRDLPVSVQMAQNPDVTLRFRGVMEKCTFCVQRVRKAGIAARNAGTEIKEGDVVTACQQVCPAQAITFGNLKDAESQIVKMKQNERTYELLAELGVKPRLSYMGRITNPNPALTKAEAVSQNSH